MSATAPPTTPPAPAGGDRAGGRRAHAALAAAAACALAVWLAAGCGGDRGTPAGHFEPDSIPDAYRFSTAALMWPGATRAFQVMPDGDLYNGDWQVRIRPSAGGVPAGPPRVIAYEERWRPIAHWTRVSGPVRWDFEAVPLPETGVGGLKLGGPAARDSGLLVALEARATSRGAAPVEAALEIALSEPDSSVCFLATDLPEEEPAQGYRWGTGEAGGVVEGWTTGEASGGVARLAWTLRPGESRARRFILPSYPTEAAALRAAEHATQARWSAAARRYWNEEVRRGARFELGDPTVEHALDAALVVLLSCRERRGSVWLPIGNPLQYRDVWLRDGARAVQALAVMGHTRVARELAAGFLGYQWPNGAFLSQRGQLDGTGQALWAFEQAWLRPPPEESVEPYADAALKAWRWFEWQRGLGRASGWPFGTMMPFADPRDNEEVRAQLVGTDAWALAGYRATARLLRAAGRAAQAESVEAARERYQEDFDRALERCGSSDVPPSWQGIGRDWGNLAASYPCGALPAGAPRAAALARRVWARAGGAGLCAYGDGDSLHYYVGADLGTWALLAGRRAAADSVLAAMLAWRSASGGAGELFSRSTRDYGRNLPPHATSAATLIALIRNSLVFDAGDTLRLTMGARAAWWRGARVRHAPTRWGTLDLEFRRRGAQAEWRWTPAPVWTALALPPGTRLAGSPPAPLARGASERVVLAPPGTRSARVALAKAP